MTKTNIMKWSVIILTLLIIVSCKKENKEAIPEVNQNGKTTFFKAYPKAQLSSGKLMRLDSFSSKYVKPRPVDVWLPKNYTKEKQYAVLYMHDGQMLFDSTTTWNKQEWKVDEWSSQLMTRNKTNQFIVVAIHNIRELRWFDLFPQKAAQYLDEKVKDSIIALKTQAGFKAQLNGDNYLKFMIEELKPIIDSEFSVHTDKENTYVMGSSMGGLMSMYAISEYPDVFNAAGCLSTHWPGVTPVTNYPLPEAIFKYMEANLPDAKTHRLYFDYGTKTLDVHYPKYGPRVDSILVDRGYNKSNSKNLMFEGTDTIQKTHGIKD